MHNSIVEILSPEAFAREVEARRRKDRQDIERRPA